MFERYTEKARRVVFFSRYEAGNMGEVKIRAIHLLLALLREGKALFFKLHVPEDSLEALRETCVKRTAGQRQKPVSTAMDLPLDEEAASIVRRTIEEADIRRDRYVDVEHLLLAALHVPSMAKDILKQQGLVYKRVRAVLLQPGDERPSGNALDYT